MSDSEALSWLAIGISVISAIGVVGGLLLNWLRLSKDSDDRFTHLLIELDNDLTKHVATEPNLKSKEECEFYAYTYLDMVTRIAFLVEKHKVSGEMMNYFNFYFQYGMTIKSWYDKSVSHSSFYSDGRWGRINDWCSTEKLDAYPSDTLPNAMRNYAKLS